MAMFKRIFLFAAVNILVLVTLSFSLQLLGVRPYLTAYGVDYRSLMSFCLVWGMGGAFISLGLSRIMAKWMMGVQVVDPQAATGDAADLVQRVHRLARAAGLPAMPEVGIYQSPELNAFATGPTKSRALVAVSSGLLSRMNEGEIEGVLGHEITHIANGDMVTMTLIQGVVNAFVMFFARAIAYALSQNVREENRRTTQIFATIALEVVLSLLGAIVVAWFSRRREYRADKGGARLAGSRKMIDALKSLQRGLETVGVESNQALATLKISGRPSGLFALLATHPPLEDRIVRLERMA